MKTLLFVYRKIRSTLSNIIYKIRSIGQFKVSDVANLHHIGLNVTNVDSTLAFYEKYFGAKRVRYNGNIDALFADNLFLLLNPVKEPPSTNQGTSLWHIGWSGEDAQLEMDWRVKEGIEVHTPVTALDDDHFMYFFGPNKEMVEVYTRKKGHAFEHIHLLASDVDKTMNWFKSHLGLDPVYRKAALNPNGFKWNYLTVNTIDIVVFGKPIGKEAWWPEEGLKPTTGSALDHIGFSFGNIESIYKELKSAGTIIPQDIKFDPVYNHKSFLVQGPDGLLIEIVEKNNQL
ncbi:VOC family protein [Maribacter sp. ANRC-HE7]|uniref:VOC family protein n=1 Tax=Maribacter aquimaris TaxID=2737171 RepID=A0ABR7V5S3_9FLAO|nr:VOC family protein [Maribacter aquimaris]MBD0780011.1 VOC family protein [Maribacter aquimaris]